MFKLIHIANNSYWVSNRFPFFQFQVPHCVQGLFSWNSSVQERSLEAKNYIAGIERGSQQCKILIMYCTMYTEVGAGLFRIFMQMLQVVLRLATRNICAYFRPTKLRNSHKGWRIKDEGEDEDEKIKCQHVRKRGKLLDSKVVETHVLLISGNMNFAFV